MYSHHWYISKIVDYVIKALHRSADDYTSQKHEYYCCCMLCACNEILIHTCLVLLQHGQMSRQSCLFNGGIIIVIEVHCGVPGSLLGPGKSPSTVWTSSPMRPTCCWRLLCAVDWSRSCPWPCTTVCSRTKTGRGEGSTGGSTWTSQTTSP